jgi:hypothetical protein
VTTARSIIRGALTFYLNRLSPGEADDADTFNVCLDALNDVADEWNGTKSFLFREILSASATGITGASGTLGVDWPDLVPGDRIEGATYSYQAGVDYPIDAISMAQYANVAIKATASLPRVYAHDGSATVYFYPAASGQTITLRTRQVVSNFADLDTDYVLPKGYKASLSACLAEKMAPTMVGTIPASVAQAATRARNRINGQAINPAILSLAGPSVPGNILSGWR